MIPQSYIPELVKTKRPDLTWRLGDEDISNDRIRGIQAVRQAVYLILNIERYEYPIYSWNYGVELWDLFGQPASFVRPELERRVRDALSQDDRITGVGAFSFFYKKEREAERKALRCTFTVHTIFGDFEGETNVRANNL